MLGRVALTNKLVSASLGIEEKQVESVTDFFFQELERELKECNHPFIFVRGLGTFVINKRQLEHRIRDLIFQMRYNKRIGKKGPLADRLMNGMRREVFYLFGIRRMIKNRWKEINQHGKNTNDTQRQLLPPDR